MKKTIVAVAAAAALCGAFVCLNDVRGQSGPAGRTAKSSAPASSSAPFKIAVIDFGMILREYRKSVDKLEEIKSAAEAGNAKIRQMQADGQALVKPLQDGNLEQESEEFREREKKIYQLENSIKSFKAAAERDMKLQSVKISLAVYQDLQAALKRFTDKNGYTLVLQIDREAAAAEDYRLIQKTIGQQIIYHRSHDDITGAVLSHLNHQYEAAGAEAGWEESAGSFSSRPVSSGNERNRTLPVSPNRKAVTR